MTLPIYHPDAKVSLQEYVLDSFEYACYVAMDEDFAYPWAETLVEDRWQHERLTALAKMPYEDYRQTSEWAAMRFEALNRDG